MPVVLIDRDGVINRNRDDHVKNVDEFEILPGVLEALSRLHIAGISAVVISNQACVGRGQTSKQAVLEVDQLMRSKVATAGGNIAATYYCFHRPDENCQCRKPMPGLLLQASREMNIDLKDAVFVGDAPTDVLAGRAAGCKTVVVLTGRTASNAEAEEMDPRADFIASDLSEAVEWILRGNQRDA